MNFVTIISICGKFDIDVWRNDCQIHVVLVLSRKRFRFRLGVDRLSLCTQRNHKLFHEFVEILFHDQTIIHHFELTTCSGRSFLVLDSVVELDRVFDQRLRGRWSATSSLPLSWENPCAWFLSDSNRKNTFHLETCSFLSQSWQKLFRVVARWVWRSTRKIRKNSTYLLQLFHRNTTISIFIKILECICVLPPSVPTSCEFCRDFHLFYRSEKKIFFFTSSVFHIDRQNKTILRRERRNENSKIDRRARLLVRRRRRREEEKRQGKRSRQRNERKLCRQRMKSRKVSADVIVGSRESETTLRDGEISIVRVVKWIVESCNSMGMTRPTPVQLECIPEIFGRLRCLCSDRIG